MDTDNIQGGIHKNNGHGKEAPGRIVENGKGLYDQAAGNVQSAYGHAKDAISSSASAAAKEFGQGARSAIDELANTDLAAFRDDLANLTQTVSQLVVNQASSTLDQVMDVAGSAGENIAQSAAVVQDQFASLEADVEARIQKNPLIAVFLAVGVGILIGKMT